MSSGTAKTLTCEFFGAEGSWPAQAMTLRTRILPNNSHVKVLAVPELIGYILWFKQPELAPDRLLQVRRYLERFVTA